MSDPNALLGRFITLSLANIGDTVLNWSIMGRIHFDK